MGDSTSAGGAPAPCARAPPAEVESPIAFSWCASPTTAAQCCPPSEKQVGHVWALSRIYPIQLNCTDSRRQARWYQLRGLPLVGPECVCPQCNSSFVIARGSAKPSAFGVPVHLSRAQKKRKQKRWNSHHGKISNRQMPQRYKQA